MSHEQITVLLEKVQAGDPSQLDQIYSLLYQDIKAIAQNQLAKIHDNQTISATVLAHECYIKLIQVSPIKHKNRRHLLNYLAKAMRRFLIDQIRNKNRQKRASQISHQNMSQIMGQHDIEFDLIDIDRLLDALTDIDPHLGELVQQKLLFNFTFKELAEIFQISERQIIRNWNQAKSLLLTMMEQSGGH